MRPAEAPIELLRPIEFAPVSARRPTELLRRSTTATRSRPNQYVMKNMGGRSA